MSLLLSLFSGLGLKLLAIAGAAGAVLWGVFAIRKSGETAQSEADEAVTLKEVKNATATDATVANMSDSQLRSVLVPPTTDKQ